MASPYASLISLSGFSYCSATSLGLTLQNVLHARLGLSHPCLGLRLGWRVSSGSLQSRDLPSIDLFDQPGLTPDRPALNLGFLHPGLLR